MTTKVIIKNLSTDKSVAIVSVSTGIKNESGIRTKSKIEMLEKVLGPGDNVELHVWARHTLEIKEE